jgi:flagellin
MGLRINQNIAAQNAYRNLSVTDSQMSKSLEKLSSGYRINRAATTRPACPFPRACVRRSAA